LIDVSPYSFTRISRASLKRLVDRSRSLPRTALAIANLASAAASAARAGVEEVPPAPDMMPIRAGARTIAQLNKTRETVLSCEGRAGETRPATGREC
jgi:hypothetical protein